MNYYNEIDPKAAAWLRELIKAGLIPNGDVDERSIVDVRPAELRAYTQCHFFAGIGGWSYALDLAGWSHDRRVWTGSSPCQPFSAAGKGDGFTDERHLWPAWFHLIRECQPDVVFGEQVASSAGLGWLDLVHADMEGEGYAGGAIDLCAAGVKSPNIRQRLFFGWKLGNTESVERRSEFQQGSERQRRSGFAGASGIGVGLANTTSGGCGIDGRASRDAGHVDERQRTGGTVADTVCQRRQQDARSASCYETSDGRAGRQSLESDRDYVAASDGSNRGVALGDTKHARLEIGVDDAGVFPGTVSASERKESQRGGDACGVGLADANGPGRRSEWRDELSSDGDAPRGRDTDGRSQDGELDITSSSGRQRLRTESEHSQSGQTGPWDELEWLYCQDGKWRPTQPGLFPLAHGVPERVGQLRGYGNAINPWVAKAFIEAFVDAEKLTTNT